MSSYRRVQRGDAVCAQQLRRTTTPIAAVIYHFHYVATEAILDELGGDQQAITGSSTGVGSRRSQRRNGASLVQQFGMLSTPMGLMP